MLDRIGFQARDGHEVSGELALPAGDARRPGLVVVHEWWGINDDIRRLARRFADEGFVTLAVDLYGGVSTSDGAEAMRLSTELSTAAAMEIIAGAVATLAAHPRCTAMVGVTGFCLGGAMALVAACNVDGLAAAVPFYGTGKDEFLDFTRAKAPILGHYAKNDAFVKAERVEELRGRAVAAGARFEVCLYDAGHAFMRAGDPAAYDKASAELAWERTMRFLRLELGAS